MNYKNRKYPSYYQIINFESMKNAKKGKMKVNIEKLN